MTLTADQIRAMPAGAELDALVATRVMGWKRREGAVFATESPWESPQGVGWDWLPQYSEDMGAAWQVAEKLKGHGGGVSVWVTSRFAEAWVSTPELTTVRAETAPEAICKAALLYASVS